MYFVSNLRMMEFIKISKDMDFAKSSKNHEIKSKQKYELLIETIGRKGYPYSSYFSVIIQDEYGRELTRFIRWMNDFTNIIKKNSLVFTTPENAKKAIVVYRINIETPVKGDFEIELPDINSLEIKETNLPESFDNIEKFEVPKLPSLTDNEENILEKNTVWTLCRDCRDSRWKTFSYTYRWCWD